MKKIKKAPVLKRKEKDIEHEILTWLNLQPGCFAFKVKTTGFFDTNLRRFRKNTSRFVIKGTSDIIGIWKGKFLAIECKTPAGFKKYTNAPTEHEMNQRAFLNLVSAVGGIGFCISSLQDAQRLLGVPCLQADK